MTPKQREVICALAESYGSDFGYCSILEGSGEPLGYPVDWLHVIVFKPSGLAAMGLAPASETIVATGIDPDGKAWM